MATATVPMAPPKRRNTALYKTSKKAPSTQAAIVLKRAKGQSKVSIAKDLGIAPNTVSSVLALSDTDAQLEQYRKDALALAPKAITAVDRDLDLPGSGALGLRVLESVGVCGDNAVQSQRRAQPHVHSAINLLVQASGNVTVQSNDNARDSVPNGTSHDNATVTTDDSTHDAPIGGQADPDPGKHPKRGPGRE